MRFARRQLTIVVEPGHGLGTLGERLCNPAGVRKHGREPVGGHARVAQEREVPVRVSDVLGQDAEVQQAHVGVGPACEPRDEYREQVTLDRRAPARSLCEGSNMRERSRRIPVADSGQSVARAIRVQGHLVLAQRRGRGDDRAVEDVLVQSAHASAYLVDSGTDRLRIREAGRPHRTPEDTQLPFLVRNQVRAPHAGQLSAVFDRAQESVARGELMRVTTRDVAALAQRLDRLQRRPHAQEGVGTTVNKLEQLNRELDVTQAAAPELELTRRVRTRDVVLDATAHRTRRLDESFARRSAPHVGLCGFLKGTPDGLVPSTGARLKQRLELPRLRPLVPVLAVGLDGAHERSVAPLGPQIRVHRPQRSFGSGPRAGGCSRRCKARRDLKGFSLVPICPGLGDVDDIDVGDVVEFARSRLTHRDDGEGDTPLRVDVPPRQGKTGLKGRVDQVGDAPTDLGHEAFRIIARQVIGGQVQQNLAIRAAQIVHPGILRGDEGAALPSRRTHGREHHARGIAGILPRRSSTAGLGNDVIAQPLAATQNGAQASARTRIIDESPHEAGVRLVQADRCQQRLIGVGTGSQVRRPYLGSTRKLLEKFEGAARVQESCNPEFVRCHRGTTFRNCSSSWRVICWRYSVHSLRLFRMT